MARLFVIPTREHQPFRPNPQMDTSNTSTHFSRKYTHTFGAVPGPLFQDRLEDDADAAPLDLREPPDLDGRLHLGCGRRQRGLPRGELRAL